MNLDADVLATVFVGLMGLAILVYAILDGYDLGVGILLPVRADQEADRDTMIASIGPFWDANETWLVLAVGILLIAFPSAHSLILTQLYLPVAVMLAGLILRGVAFDFRAKAALDHKLAWDRTFKAGSLITTLSQGYMLGIYVTGFQWNWANQLFALIAALGVSVAYSYIGATWLVLKTEADLQRRAVQWARSAGRITFLGVVSVCLTNLWVNPHVFDRWLQMPLAMFVLLIPMLCFLALLGNDMLLKRLPKAGDRHCGVPFALVILVFVCCFSGLAFSFFPEVVPGQMTIWEAASAAESLQFILIGALVVIPAILLYTAFSYWVFRGKTTELHYH